MEHIVSLFSYQNLKKILFKLDPETAHTVAGLGLRAISHCPSLLRFVKNQNFVTHPMLQQEIFGRTFQNPVGLGAGFDKNGQYITAMPTLGFGFTEIGTVTPKPQADVLLKAVRFNAKRSGNDTEFTLGSEYPLLVVCQSPVTRTAAFASDVAPHWVGPLVDWGTERLKAKAKDAGEIEVGNHYAEFFANLIKWLCKK